MKHCKFKSIDTHFRVRRTDVSGRGYWIFFLAPLREIKLYKGFNMSALSYQRLLNVRYSSLIKNGLPLIDATGLDDVLALPHIQREHAFVVWAQRTGPYVDALARQKSPIEERL